MRTDKLWAQAVLNSDGKHERIFQTKIDLKKNDRRHKSVQNYSVCKEVNL